jgi:hypothetical protein
MNRFTQKRTVSHIIPKLLLSLTVFVLAIAALWQGTAAIGTTANDSQIDSLRQAVLRSAVHCYAMEGAYPESLDYLKEHYGIDWDTSKYIVDYEVTGSNLMPDVSVFAIGNGVGQK